MKKSFPRTCHCIWSLTKMFLLLTVWYKSKEVQTKDGIFKLLRGQESITKKIDSACLCNMAGRYENPFHNRFLTPIDCSKFPAQANIFALRDFPPKMLKILIKFPYTINILYSTSHSVSVPNRSGNPYR
jgi:hypothetical protein